MDVGQAVKWTVMWSRAYLAGEDGMELMDDQIYKFFQSERK